MYSFRESGWAPTPAPAVRPARSGSATTGHGTKGRGGPEILAECITYGAAGMVTTREFIAVVAWHH